MTTPVPALALALAVTLVTGPAGAQSAARPADPAAARAERTRGLELAYNLDYPDARAAFERAVALDPDHPAGPRLLAAITWMTLLFERGAILVDDYLGPAEAEFDLKPPPAAAHQYFHTQIARSLALGEARLAANPADPDAHYQVGATAGFLATYIATVEGRVFGSLQAGQRAYREHARVLALDPARSDAGFLVGTYQYGVSTFALPLRLLARIVGFGTGREQGRALIEAAARQVSDVQADALFGLILIYNREGRYDDALAAITRLRERYPANRLLWLEAGATALRAGRLDEAEAALARGRQLLDADVRPRAYGELARWQLAGGRVRLGRQDLAGADRELRAALAATAPGWVHGRVHVALGKVDDLRGQRAGATAAYERGRALCAAGQDDACVEEARTLVRAAYRGGRP